MMHLGFYAAFSWRAAPPRSQHHCGNHAHRRPRRYAAQRMHEPDVQHNYIRRCRAASGDPSTGDSSRFYYPRSTPSGALSSVASTELILYYINFYGLDAFSPWFIEERDSVSMVSHFVFGAVVASAYRAIRLHWYGGWNEPLASVDE